jgi:hypothetical protein
MIVTFISIHFVIICDVFWRIYETHLTLSFKSRCHAKEPVSENLSESMGRQKFTEENGPTKRNM